ncbi:MAG: hypothetical protein IKU70_13200 [Clostridia bacterium]|nr:hypothetical protein [Clostridia bacterium]
MKKMYQTPKAHKVDYSFQEQLVAQSWPIAGYADPWKHSVCTYDDGVCSKVYLMNARGINDCTTLPGNPDLLDPYDDCL